ncbi:bifunctional methylenetetrahydrofolate dehydrogenase/methenyltetrahydrofolate cyclohydrolase FolD [Candidatus Persebacteraceae bacterium Df01]|jgi:methylenetetrahydrofolate dehydrogenase (NADP+)/methenyltetrahydrofolate cyclohydrolase|uniref:Bifunctional protein FolD n=1 Tax=Candidatus Doriopsillibacter californiensis TaxID=2970740 RepID=A0ABT7QKV8_9GAMM|nr:bifunctional methylenetetrahydrofolate dehydrogenase/methenyltetrahydrofolate cyclohydrolase FolD [Candidatus Persebacteraceae bacterium Df01]
MESTIINGRAVADEVLASCATKISQGDVVPGLAVIIVGDNPASQVYVRNKVRACEKAGLHSEKYALSVDVSEVELLGKVAQLNADPAIHGILVQLPLPAHINEDKVLTAIAAHKDVDGFHPENIGRLVAGLPGLRPCTPAGCMVLLERAGVSLSGSRAVVIGRSNIVGKPMALMLINAGATVTVCNSKTPSLAATVQQADIVIAAVGRPRLITAEMIKSGATVIDVGINREDGGLVGDVDFESVRTVAGAITPVPGGVGPMTIAMLVSNTLQAAIA